MSLSSALTIAFSGLSINQAAIRNTSNNIANVNTEGYSQKIFSQKTRLIDGQSAGVTEAGIRRGVNENLLIQFRGQITEMQHSNVVDRFYQQMQNMFGSPDGNGSLGNHAANLSSALEAFAANPEGLAERNDVVNSAVAISDNVQQLTKSIQELRQQADSEIEDAVADLSAQAKRINELNVEISRNKALGFDTTGLEDERDIAVNKVAEYVEISTFKRADGQMSIYTKQGPSVVDGGVPPMTYSAFGGVNAQTTYPADFGAISIGGVDITPSLTKGKLAGLVELRDTVLPNLQAEIDQFATKLRDELNAIHNQGTSFPPRQTVTGTTTITGGGAFSLAGSTGTVRVSVLNNDGTLAAAPLDIDLTTTADVNAVLTAINTNPAFAGLVTASVDANNKLSIVATNADDGIAINESTSNVVGGGRGFSHFFGLNDLLVGDTTINLGSTLTVRSDVKSDPQLLSSGALSNAGGLVTNDVALTAGDNSIAQLLANKLTADVSFAAAGNLGATTTSFSEYGASILSTNAAAAVREAESLAFRSTLHDEMSVQLSQFTGVNIDEELARLVELENAFGASARVVSIINDMFETLVNVV